MKHRPIIIACLAIGLAGCETLSDATINVREKLAARDEGRTKTYSAPPRETYEAVRAAANQMGYRFVRGGAAQGEFEAVNSVTSDDSRRGSRQISMKAKLHGTLDGKGTDITVRLTEVLESDSANKAGMATESPLRDTPQYEVFFRSVQQALDGKK